MADAAIRVGRKRPRLASIHGVRHVRRLFVFVFVVTEMGASTQLLMRADARSRGPGPLERQHNHQEDKQEATHERRQSSKATNRGRSLRE